MQEDLRESNSIQIWMILNPHSPYTFKHMAYFALHLSIVCIPMSLKNQNIAFT